jgi:hypothetical protein
MWLCLIPTNLLLLLLVQRFFVVAVVLILAEVVDDDIAILTIFSRQIVAHTILSILGNKHNSDFVVFFSFCGYTVIY